MMELFVTTHQLQFLVRPLPPIMGGDDGWMEFKVGTVTGQWKDTSENYVILSFNNRCKGNGHLDDVFEWFEHSCKRDNRNLLIEEIINPHFYKHLTDKRGFVPLSEKPEHQNSLIKYL